MHQLKQPHDAKVWSIPGDSFANHVIFGNVHRHFLLLLLCEDCYELEAKAVAVHPITHRICHLHGRSIVPRINNLDAEKPRPILLGSWIGFSLFPCSPLPNLYFKNNFTGDFPTGQWCRLPAPNTRDPSSIPGQGTWSHMLQLWVCMLQLRPDTGRQINKHKNFFSSFVSMKYFLKHKELLWLKMHWSLGVPLALLSMTLWNGP